MQRFSDQRLAAISWACVISALGLALTVPGYGAATFVAAAALALVAWQFPPGKFAAKVRPGDLLWTTEGLEPAYTADRLRPGLLRDFALVQGAARPPAEPLSPHLRASEIALRAMHRGGIADVRELSDRDVFALALLRDAILADPPRAACLATMFRDPAAVLDLRERMRGGATFEVGSHRVA
ncbi:hypothetical protein [Citreimonas salinaria]|uniref:Uncharacterized protein n=1 Tax=Citreimonas salinaria TaxID=321339 RepID=A0A1H3FI88_9RHOB|nr:hypothetical protein [Citreimonas salinaria]SDX89854.1 hypothetical protein SAMN05444340_101408 [Citreimonas salinaria]